MTALIKMAALLRQHTVLRSGSTVGGCQWRQSESAHAHAHRKHVVPRAAARARAGGQLSATPPTPKRLPAAPRFATIIKTDELNSGALF